MIEEAVEVMVSLRSSGGLLGKRESRISGFRVLELGEGGSVYVDVDALGR